MGHVQFILENRKKHVQAEIPPAPIRSVILPQGLPGINRRERQLKLNKTALKRQYNEALVGLRNLNKTRKSMRREKKREMTARIAGLKGRMSDLLEGIGVYTPEEKLHGFREDNDGF